MSSSEIQKKSSKRSRLDSSTMQSRVSENSPENDMDEDDSGTNEEDELNEEEQAVAAVVEAKVDEGPKEKGGKIVRNYIPLSKRATSPFWAHFKKYVDDVTGKERAECIYCGATFAAHSNDNGTKNLGKHSKNCSSNPANKSKGTQSTLVLEKIDESAYCKMRNWVLDQREARIAVAQFLILDELPFRLVEKLGFKRLLSVLCPTFILPSRYTVARDCYDLFLQEKVMLKGFLSKSCQRVSLTTDSWTSIQRINYMCVTAHFIDNDWKLQKRILNFCPIVGHKGEDIARGVDDCLRPWGLAKKVFTITVDNASANDSAIASLKGFMIENGGCINNADNVHMRCVAHIANLIVGDGLKLHVACIDKVRAFVKYHRGYPSRVRLFKEEAVKLRIESNCSLILDVPTRWNSTYMMLEVALKYKNVFSRLDPPKNAKGEAMEHITIGEWSKVEILVKFLKEFYDFTKDVSGSSYVCVNNVFFYIATLVESLNHWIDSDDEDCRSMAFEMKMKCDKYWGDIEKMNMLIFVAIILDPTYKFSMVETGLENLYGLHKGQELAQIVKAFADKLFNAYREMYSPSSPTNEATVGAAPSKQVKKGGPRFLKSCSQIVKRREESDGGVFKSEFDRYLNELRPEFDQSEILTWWKLNELRYPILARMARDVLAIPISSVPSESAFSTGGRTLDHFRSSLTPKTVQALICTQDWLRANESSSRKVYVDEDDGENEELLKNVEQDVEKDIPLSTLTIEDKEPIYF